MKEAAGKSATASGDRGGSNSSKPKAIGGKPSRQKVNTFSTVLILFEHLKLRLMNNMKLATEPCVHCSFYIVKSIAQLKLEILDYKISELTYFYILNYLSIINLYFSTTPAQFFDTIIVISILQANSKRQVDESILDEESKRKAKKVRGEKPKLKYSDVAKAGYLMMEVRASNPNVELGQPDYDTIESGLAHAYVNLPEPRPVEIPRIFQMGLSQGGSWIGAKDEFTLQFALVHIPTLTMPPGTGYYQYYVYGPDNRPNKYFKTTCPVRYWDSREKLLEVIIAFHPELKATIIDRFGTPRIPHIRISSGMENPEDIVGGYFPLVIEAEEALGPVFGRLGGTLRILATELRLVGGGIEVFINEAKAAEAARKAALIPVIEIDNMETEQSNEVPMAPPPPGASTSAEQLPPPPALQQMRPRTPPPTSSSQNAN